MFGEIHSDLNLAANWLKRFPRTSPAPGMAAARVGHVMVLVKHITGNRWLVHDGNSGGGLTRNHIRSIKGFTIVDPQITLMAKRKPAESKRTAVAANRSERLPLPRERASEPVPNQVAAVSLEEIATVPAKWVPIAPEWMAAIPFERVSEGPIEEMIARKRKPDVPHDEPAAVAAGPMPLPPERPADIPLTQVAVAILKEAIPLPRKRPADVSLTLVATAAEPTPLPRKRPTAIPLTGIAAIPAEPTSVALERPDPIPPEQVAALPPEPTTPASEQPDVAAPPEMAAAPAEPATDEPADVPPEKVAKRPAVQADAQPAEPAASAPAEHAAPAPKPAPAGPVKQVAAIPVEQTPAEPVALPRERIDPLTHTAANPAEQIPDKPIPVVPLDRIAAIPVKQAPAVRLVTYTDRSRQRGSLKHARRRTPTLADRAAIVVKDAMHFVKRLLTPTKLRRHS